MRKFFTVKEIGGFEPSATSNPKASIKTIAEQLIAICVVALDPTQVYFGYPYKGTTNAEFIVLREWHKLGAKRFEKTNEFRKIKTNQFQEIFYGGMQKLIQSQVALGQVTELPNGMKHYL